tara:strand:- start:10246 stop:11277 length:1032 start_codon:yes stop_codon:yes gene_type:complete
MKILIKIFIVSISLSTVYFHYVNHISGEIQYDLYEDINSSNYKEQTTARFNVLNLDFPDLSLTTLPMKGIVARYYYLGAQYSKALDLLNQSSGENPYIMYNESLKSEIYSKLGVIDSALIYAEKAFSGIAHNQKHFLELSKIYVNTNKYSKLDSIFKIVEKKNLPPLWRFYLASALTREDSISDYSKIKAREALTRFNDGEFSSEIRLSSIYILYGTERINESIEAAELANKYFDEENFRLASEYFEKAADLNPEEYTYFENAGISNYKFGYYDEAIKYLSHVVDSINPGTGKSEFVLAQSYAGVKDFENACKYIYDSSKYNYEASYQLIGEYCNKAQNDNSN